MANFDAAKAIFTQVDRNQDGSIDRNEFRSWVSNNNGLTTSSFESPGNISNNNLVIQAGITGLEGSSQSAFESSTGVNASYGTAAAASSSEQIGGAAIQTSSIQQTNEYLSQTAAGIYNDPNPQIVRRANTEGPVTYQQRILVRFLQPPALPPPGPLIIKEVRPPQPPPPPPLVVRQRAPALPTPPPLVLRERPPVLPAAIASQTVIRRLAAIPAPPRSVIIERLPALPPKPRDIIIERWIPYGAQAQRRTIIQRAAAAVRYPEPRNIIVVYDNVQARVIRQFQRLGVTQENPQAYVARYGASLLDAATLVQHARTAGVVEDISPPAVSSSTQFASSASFFANTAGNSAATDASAFGFEAANSANANYTSSSNFLGDSAFASSAGVNSTGFDVLGASFAAADTNRDGRLDQGEFQQFVQGGI